MQFRDFLLNENRARLGDKIGSILSSVHDIRDDLDNLGSRQIIRFCEKLVSNIRRILHTGWTQTEEKHLHRLQKVAVAIMKSVDEHGDIKELFPSIAQELEEISSELGVPVNKLGSSGDEEEETPENPPDGDT